MERTEKIKPDYTKYTIGQLQELSLGHLMMLKKKAHTVSYACDCCGELLSKEAERLAEEHGYYQNRIKFALQGKGHYPNKAETKLKRQLLAKPKKERKQMAY